MPHPYKMNEMELQPILENELVKLIPLKKEDFEMLYEVASDPLIWEQHPDKYRYTKEGFEKYFRSAIESRGAFLGKEKNFDGIIGSSRYYDYDEEKKSIAIGYTFLARKYWGTTYNRAMKTLMLDHAFKYVETVIFHIGNKNLRSQKAIEKLGAKKVEEIEIQSPNESENLKFLYEIDQLNWSKIRNSKQE